MIHRPTHFLPLLVVGVSLSLCGFQTAASSSAQMVGWYTASVAQNGSSAPTQYVPGNSLPSGLSIFLDTDATLITATGTAAQMRCNGTGVPNGVILADVVGKGVITTAEAFPQALPWRVQLTYRCSASVSVSVMNVGANATSSAFGYVARVADTATDTTPPGIGKEDGPHIMKRNAKVVSASWTGSAGHMTGAFAVPMSTQGGQVFATSGVYRGNAFAAGGQAGSGISVKITGCKASGSGIVTMSIPAGSFAALMDIYDAGGNLVDNWMIDRDNSNIGTLDVDNYAAGQYTLLIRTKGTLVSKVVANLSPNGSTAISPTWRWGDLDGDNYVTRDEINFIQTHLGANANAVDSYFPDHSGPYATKWYTIHDADFNHDGVISQTDLDLASMNVGVHGDTL